MRFQAQSQSPKLIPPGALEYKLPLRVCFATRGLSFRYSVPFSHWLSGKCAGSAPQLCPTLATPCTVCRQPPWLLCPWDFPGKATGVVGHFLLQGIFPTQGSNPGFLHCRQSLYLLSHQGSPYFSVNSSNTIPCFSYNFVFLTVPLIWILRFLL